MYYGAVEIMQALKRRETITGIRAMKDEGKEPEFSKKKEYLFGKSVACKLKRAMLIFMVIFLACYACAEFATLSFVPALCDEGVILKSVGNRWVILKK